LEDFDFSFGSDLIHHRLEIVILIGDNPREPDLIHPKHRWIIGREMKVRRLLLVDRFEKSLNASHGWSLMQKRN